MRESRHVVLGLALSSLLTACSGHTANPAVSGDSNAERVSTLGSEASAISFERMARYPEPGWHVPREIGWSADGRTVTYLASESASEKMALFGLDVATGTSRVLVRDTDLERQSSPMSTAEELRRERQRSRIEGITSYRSAKHADVIVIPAGGDLFARTPAGIARLTSTPEPELDPVACNGGQRVAFVRGSELFAVDLATRTETPLTSGSPEGVTHGQSDFNGQEEFDEPSGFFWSPDCEKIALLEVDERKVDEVAVLGFRGGRADLMMQRYPATGRTNPSVRVGIVDVSTKRTTWLTLPGTEARYVARFRWAADGKSLYFQALSRDQKRLTLLRADAATGEATELFSETSNTWIEFAEARPLEKRDALLWVSGSGAHRHLELYDGTSAKRLARLTSGEWDVVELLGVDASEQHAIISATKDAPLDRHTYRVALDGSSIQRLTPEPGVHRVTLDPLGQRFVDVHSAIDRLPEAVIRAADGTIAARLTVPRDSDFETLGIRTPEIVSVPSPSGVNLYGALLRPRAMLPGRRYPVVVMVYGGPGVQTVLNQWSARLFWQHLADRGFVIFQLDNRGSSGRGPAFETPIYGHLGDVELADQLAGLDYLESLPFVERGRAAIYGHSYGGYMAALAMLRAPKRFRLGIAGSPVTDWSLYDTGYTERYMGIPSQNAAGYAASSLAPLASALEGRLFLLHALMDENVHLENTTRLVDALVAANKPFDLLVFPGERHGYRSPTARTYAARRVADYLATHL